MFWFFLTAAVFCFIYYLVIILYTGIAFSYFIWLFFGLIFCILASVVRFYILHPQKIPLYIIVGIHTLTISGLLIFAILQILIFSAAAVKVEPQLDYIIVLGAGVMPNGGLSKSLYNRVLKAEQYVLEYPATLIVLSGGQGRDEPISEAEAMANYLLRRGVAPENLYLEIQSTSTKENVLYSKVLIERVIENKSEENTGNIGDGSGPVLEAENRPKRIGIITNSFHIYRAIALARKTGFDELYAIPAQSDSVLYLHFSTRECIAILKDKFMGYY